MQLARVIGTVVATRKYQGLEGVKLLVIQPLDKQQRPAGEPVVAADATAQAGPGELVFVVASREAALALPTWFVPVDRAIVGIVDQVSTVLGRKSEAGREGNKEAGRQGDKEAGKQVETESRP